MCISFLVLVRYSPPISAAYRRQARSPFGDGLQGCIRSILFYWVSCYLAERGGNVRNKRLMFFVYEMKDFDAQ